MPIWNNPSQVILKNVKKHIIEAMDSKEGMRLKHNIVLSRQLQGFHGVKQGLTQALSR